MYKKIMALSLIFISVCLAAVCIFVIGGIRTMASEENINLYIQNAERESPVRLTSNVYAVQFCTDSSFESVKIYVSKVTLNGVPQMTVKVYKWSGNYGTTVSSVPAVDVALTDIKAKEWAELICSDESGNPLSAGEYLIVIDNGKGNVHLEITMPALPDTRTYFNTSPRGGSLKIQIHSADGGGLVAISENNNIYSACPDTWVATDGLERKIEASYSDTTREGKYVGLFFHTWHGLNAKRGARNVTEILKEHPEIVSDYQSPLWGNAQIFFWNEPVWGYYATGDEWVLRRQAELLADAQVDVVFFDNTNGTETFMDDALTLMKVWAKARTDGVKTPDVAFMLPMFDYDDVAAQLRELYAVIYSEELYSDLWFYWKGKPLIIGYPGRLDPSDRTDAEILDFFNYRVINHAQSQDHIQVQNNDGNPIVKGEIQSEVTDKYQLWNWISVYPQLVNNNQDGSAEQVAVAVAHNWCTETHLTAMSNQNATVYGRHYMPKEGIYDTRENAKLYGAYFSEQWEYALKVDPEFIWITGWNEWTAGRYEDFWGVPNAFIDQFSDEYSRDIEPSKGDLKDYYYYQMVYYIRKFKGVSASKPAAAHKIDIYSDEDMWAGVENIYESYKGDTFARDARGYIDSETKEAPRYTDNTGRNDIVRAKAAYDDEYVYFMAETADELTPYTDRAWMRLFIEVESTAGKPVVRDSWESFQYIVNRETPASADVTALEISNGGWSWSFLDNVKYRVYGNRIQIQIPRALLGVADNNFVINFKWSDNMQTDGDVMDFYTHGDTAPGGRFKYRFTVGEIPAYMNSDGKSFLWPWSVGGIAAAAVGGVTLGLVLRKKRGKRECTDET